MSKRCCAFDCFNSILNNKSIQYFSFPKSEKYGQIWAVNCGRKDLLQKSIKSLIKYYLCSDHFTDDCFIDGSNKTKLKRNLPHSIAIPTIFKNNLNDFVYNNNNKHKQDEEVKIHNFIVLNRKISKELLFYPDDHHLTIEYNEHLQASNDDKNVPIVNILSETYNTNKSIDTSKCLSDLINSPLMQQDDLIEEDLLAKCRLCGVNISENELCYPLFKDGEVLKEFMLRVFSNKISENDGKSQIACHTCALNVEKCFQVLHDIDEHQKLIDFT